MEKIICVFRDSTAWGAWDYEKGGWVNRLWLSVAERNNRNNNYYVEIYNLSVSGGTTETILARFENEAKIRNVNILIFQTGGNDAAYEHKEDNYQIPPEKFRANLEEIIRRAKKITNKIVFVGFKNVDEKRTTPVPWRDIYYTNANIKKYSEIMKKICEENKIPFIDIFGLLQDNDLEDGVHPNIEGHRKIFEVVNKFLKDAKII